MIYHMLHANPSFSTITLINHTHSTFLSLLTLRQSLSLRTNASVCCLSRKHSIIWKLFFRVTTLYLFWRVRSTVLRMSMWRKEVGLRSE